MKIALTPAAEKFPPSKSGYLYKFQRRDGRGRWHTRLQSRNPNNFAEEYERAPGPKRVIRVDPDTGEFCGVLLESEKLSGLPAPVGPFSIPHR